MFPVRLSPCLPRSGPDSRSSLNSYPLRPWTVKSSRLLCPLALGTYLAVTPAPPIQPISLPSECGPSNPVVNAPPDPARPAGSLPLGSFLRAARSHNTQPAADPPGYATSGSRTHTPQPSVQAPSKKSQWTDIGLEQRLRYEHRENDLRSDSRDLRAGGFGVDGLCCFAPAFTGAFGKFGIRSGSLSKSRIPRFSVQGGGVRFPGGTKSTSVPPSGCMRLCIGKNCCRTTPSATHVR
jgi:hypothetical protein